MEPRSVLIFLKPFPGDFQMFQCVWMFVGERYTRLVWRTGDLRFCPALPPHMRSVNECGFIFIALKHS